MCYHHVSKITCWDLAGLPKAVVMLDKFGNSSANPEVHVFIMLWFLFSPLVFPGISENWKQSHLGAVHLCGMLPGNNDMSASERVWKAASEGV